MNNNNEHLEVNEITPAMKTSLKTRIISAIVLILICVPTILFGDYAIITLGVVVCAVGTYEIINCAKPKHSWWLTIISAVLILLLAFWPLLKNVMAINNSNGWKPWANYETIYISVIVLIASLIIILFFVVIDKNTTVSDASFIFVAGVLLAIGVQCLVFLRQFPIVDHYGYTIGQPLPNVSYFNLYENLESATLFIYVGIGTFLNDAGAYFAGILLGKHKMNVRISPKKTWEGFVGGVIVSFIGSFAFAMILASCKHPILSAFDLSHWYNILALSLIMPAFATLGDFVFSSFKRFYGVKDFSRIIPGHGGVLDRIDSLLFVGIIAAVFICIVSGGEMALL